MLSLALLVALSSPPTQRWDFPDGTSASLTSSDPAERRIADYAGFLSDTASDFADWVILLEPMFNGGPEHTPLGQCVTQAQQTCGAGKVCWVFVQGQGSGGSCSFGCAIAGAVPPCPPPPAQIPPAQDQAD